MIKTKKKTMFIPVKMKFKKFLFGYLENRNPISLSLSSSFTLALSEAAQTYGKTPIPFPNRCMKKFVLLAVFNVRHLISLSTL